LGALGNFSSKVGHTNLVFGVPSGFVRKLADYKAMCAVAMICNIQTDTQTAFDPLI